MVGAGLIVVFSRARVPSPSQWQEWIRAIEPVLFLDSCFEPKRLHGELVCSLFDQDCGFAYYLDALDQRSREDLGGLCASDWDSMLALVARGGLVDYEAAVLAAAAFAIGSDGCVVGDHGDAMDKSSMLQGARRASISAPHSNRSRLKA
jgi:hypothetical protein